MNVLVKKIKYIQNEDHHVWDGPQVSLGSALMQDLIRDETIRAFTKFLKTETQKELKFFLSNSFF